MFAPVVAGVIIVPETVHLARDVNVSVSLIDASRPDRKAIEVSSLTMKVGALLKGTTLPFALSYHPAKLDSETYEWYTLRVKVETAEGDLLWFNHRVTRAIDDAGLPIRDLNVKLTAAGQKSQANPAAASQTVHKPRTQPAAASHTLQRSRTQPAAAPFQKSRIQQAPVQQKAWI